MREQVIAVMARVFEMNVADFPTEINQNTIENWDSLRHLNFIVELEEEFDTSFEPEQISEMTSMEKVLEMLEK